MADPLSVAASVIAVVGAVRMTIKGLEKIISLEDAPDLIKQLSSEVRVRHRSLSYGANLLLARRSPKSPCCCTLQILQRMTTYA